MEEALRFFRAFEVWIYILLGLGGLYFIRKFVLAWQELREAGFGLERENAQGKVNQAAIVLVILLTMAISEFVLVSYIAPAVPEANPLPTPTLNILATPTTTLAAAPSPSVEGTPLSPTPSTPTPIGESGCIPAQIEIAYPGEGMEVSGVVVITGTVDLANFGFYKLIMKHPEDPSWMTIQAGNRVVQGGKLGDWDTTRLVPGEYLLGVEVVDNQAKPMPACVVRLRVGRPPESTPNP